MAKVYNIVGPLGITRRDFNTHYAPRIMDANARGGKFIVENSTQFDEYVQYYLRDIGVDPANVTVFSKLDDDVPYGYTKHVVLLDPERRNLITYASDEDIMWVEGTPDFMQVYKRRQDRMIAEAIPKPALTASAIYIGK